MYSIYRQVHPVTGIESAVYCNLIDPVVKSLVIGGVNYLHIYHLNSDTDTSSSAAILVCTTEGFLVTYQNFLTDLNMDFYIRNIDLPRLSAHE